MPKYSVIVPIYNRPNEAEELLESLAKQSFKNFDIIIIEDGSSEDCSTIIKNYANNLDIKYHFKANSGPGDSRNVGMSMATGDYLIFFDSDCIIPPQYFEEVEKHLAQTPLDAFGGPDSAHESFSKVQKAINYAMTSIITTGGVRGKKNKLDQYQPRSFNMGISQAVYKKVGGYTDVTPGEDPDLSYRIMNAGFRVGLIEDAYVFHKRRIDFSKFIKQVYKFGVMRPVLIKWYPDKFKLTYTFPTLFLLFSLLLIVLSIAINPIFLSPLALIAIILFMESLIKTKSLSISLLAILASFIQLFSYGYGFLKSTILILLLKKEERIVFDNFFFDKSKRPKKQ
ncbi:glycosyltransferase [Ancylomarina euxinus]|uniref:Glycosyltransferase n=1 Tax=Ancylomarina euxinus TaxID=2283627 RepID=A0A425Y8R9_9BACT|nr:glycosyltransferase [Ancylomarina euxinus]MCZ4693398.1 glycosyltransferase [Ancylomarina euxinus]MUP13625.1 glycosyltransferase [Ancylomarina euxinus]RRG24732.1 glycosyltransferase [Ancylomarina euxinus]